MDDENVSCVHDGEEDTQLSLLHLPIEIFLHICSFLEASTLIHSLSLVCKQFYLILKDDSLWKKRINHMWPDASYPLLRPARPDKLFWKLSCVALEKQTALWKQRDSMDNLIITGVLGRSALVQMHDGTTCIVASSSGTLVYWKLSSHEKLPSYEIEHSGYINFAHDQCICELTAIDNTIYSCGWDHSVKLWMLMNTGLVHQRTYKMKYLWENLEYVSALSAYPETSLFAIGSSSGTIFVCDSRSQHMPIRQYRPHNKFVIKLAMNLEYILSASGDNTVSVWDQRAGRTMKSITFPDEAYPTCMSMQQDCVLVGDSAAKLHVLNPKNDFELVKSYSTEHTDEITGVHLTHGCLITSSKDGTVSISSPTDPPKSIATLFSEFRYLRPIYTMDYLNGILMTTNYDDIVMWRPKWTCSTK